MQFSTKNLAIIGLVIILAATNVAFAVLYMTKSVNISGGVAAMGAIEVYDADGLTPIIGLGFPLFTGGIYDTKYQDFFVNNTGNVPVYVFWNISTSSISWEISGYEYFHWESSMLKYQYRLDFSGTIDHWYPYVSGSPQETVNLGVGEGKKIRLFLTYTGSVNTAETFSLVMSFHAKDSPP